MKKFFSLIAAVLFAGSMMAATATMQYTGGVTTNMVGNGANNAETVGLDATLFTVLAYNNGNQNLPGLNKANDIRLYADRSTGNGNTIVVSIANGTITSIELNIKQTATFVVKAGENEVTESEGAYAINAASFSIQNTTTGATTQLQLNSITITYETEGGSEPTPDYFLVGTNNGWDGTGYQFAENPGAEGEYMLDVTFAAADEFKVIGVLDGDTTWFPDGENNNYIVNEAGEYTVYFRPEYQEAWENFYTIVPKVAQDIEVNISEGLRYDDYVATDGWWQIYGNDEHFAVSISNLSTTQAEGIYTIDDLDADYTYITAINSTDTTHFVDGSVTLSIDAQTGNVTVAGTLVGDDGNNYIFNLQFIVPTPQETVNVNIQNAELIDYYADYGLYGVYGTDANGVYVQLAVWVDEVFQGQFTEEDLDMQYIGSGLMIGDAQEAIYTAAITVTPGNGGDYNITATLLCYNNTQYNVTMYVPATADGLEGVDAAVKAIKTLVNGNVVIEKNGVKYSVNGQIVK